MSVALHALDPRALARSIWSPEDFRDPRLFRRLLLNFELLFRRFDAPLSSVPRAPRRGFSRFLENPRLDPTRMSARMLEHSRAALCHFPRLVLSHDTTEVDLAGRYEPEDAGPLRSNAARGYLVHSSFAIDASTGQLLGTVSFRAWTRPWKLRQQNHKSRPPHRKESRKWRRGIEDAVTALREAGCTASLLHVFDAEGDVYENFAHARRHRHQVLVRAAQDRSIQEGKGKLWSYLASQPAVAHWEQSVRTEVSKEARKAAEKKGTRALARFDAQVEAYGPQRRATLELAYAKVTLTPTKGSRKALKMTALRIYEAGAPKELEPIDWVLLTTVPVESWKDALGVVHAYSQRYGIEPVHKVWKSGLHLEEEAVKDLAGFQRMLAMVVPAATHLLRWEQAARHTPQSPAATWVEPEVVEGLKHACRHHGRPLPRRAWTIWDVVLKLAQLGGYEPRKGAAPGWKTIWRGWRELQRFMDVLSYARAP